MNGEKITVEVEVECKMRYITRIDLTPQEFAEWDKKLDGFGRSHRDAAEKLADTYIDWRDDWQDTTDIEVLSFAPVEDCDG